MPVSTLAIETVTPGSTACCWSVTSPWSVAPMFCADVRPAMKAIKKAAVSTEVVLGADIIAPPRIEQVLQRGGVYTRGKATLQTFHVDPAIFRRICQVWMSRFATSTI